MDAFANESSIKILVKGVVRLQSEKLKATNVFRVKYLKRNLLSVNTMCDQGYTLTFNAWKCEIREAYIGIWVAPTKRAKDNKKECELLLSSIK